MHWWPNLIRNTIKNKCNCLIEHCQETENLYDSTYMINDLLFVNALAVVVKTILILYLFNLEPISLKYVRCVYLITEIKTLEMSW